MEDPVPGPDGCTVSSIVHPQWSLSAFEIDSNASAPAGNDSSSSSVSFAIILETGNSFFDYPVTISQDTQVANTSWYTCAIGPSGDTGPPLWPDDCTFQYEPTTKQLTIKADWTCNDLDPDHP